MLMLSSSMSEKSSGVPGSGTSTATTEITSKPSLGWPLLNIARRTAIIFQILMSMPLFQKKSCGRDLNRRLLEEALPDLVDEVSSLWRSISSSKLVGGLLQR